jgi:hypothetical protein
MLLEILCAVVGKPTSHGTDEVRYYQPASPGQLEPQSNRFTQKSVLSRAFCQALGLVADPNGLQPSDGFVAARAESNI